jgi:hypothetical protein
MRCKIFAGNPLTAQDQFNQWAKGKVLNREVIIQTQVTERIEGCDETSPKLMIIVFYPEDSTWEEKLTAPVHMTPTEKYVKVAEMEVK